MITRAEVAKRGGEIQREGPLRPKRIISLYKNL